MPRDGSIPTPSSVDLGRELVGIRPWLRYQAFLLTGHHADADDLTSETVLRALSRRHLFDGQHLPMWLLTIMRNLRINHLRRGRVDLVADVADLAGGVPAPQEWAVMFGEADVALARVPEHYRAAFLAIRIEGEELSDFAARTGVAIGTVKSRSARGAEALRAMLDGGAA